jgi:hypothetical protein
MHPLMLLGLCMFHLKTLRLRSEDFCESMHKYVSHECNHGAKTTPDVLIDRPLPPFDSENPHNHILVAKLRHTSLPKLMHSRAKWTR